MAVALGSPTDVAGTSSGRASSITGHPPIFRRCEPRPRSAAGPELSSTSCSKSCRGTSHGESKLCGPAPARRCVLRTGPTLRRPQSQADGTGQPWLTTSGPPRSRWRWPAPSERNVNGVVTMLIRDRARLAEVPVALLLGEAAAISRRLRRARQWDVLVPTKATPFRLIGFSGCSRRSFCHTWRK
jgi:hypothetical protein